MDRMREKGGNVARTNQSGDTKIRLYPFVEMDTPTANRLFHHFNPMIAVKSVTPIHKGMSTSNFIVQTDQDRYLLKLYTNPTEGIEHTMYGYLLHKISVPQMVHYDDTQTIIPYRYAIIDYIDGLTLDEYIKTKKRYPMELVDQIAAALAVIHRKTYDRRGLLDHHMQIKETFPSTKEQIQRLLAEKAGTYLPMTLRYRLQNYVDADPELCKRIESCFVLSHGDFSYSNIIIDQQDRAWFIDFEYALSANWLHDIAKFFRRKATPSRNASMSLCMTSSK